MVSYNDETWAHVRSKIEEQIEKRKAILINDDTIYKDMLRAQGAIAALRTILELPRTAQLVAATPKRG